LTASRSNRDRLGHRASHAGILHSPTVLEIAEHAIDTQGAIELVFALFDLFGSPPSQDRATPASCACTASARQPASASTSC